MSHPPTGQYMAKYVNLFTKENKMKKSYIVLAVMLIATMLLGACAPKATEAPVVEEPVVEDACR